ncbi:MAG: 50S ribosomal protein L15 [Candidatus Staskawiczbacteria bacterium RIFCSPLOWO2_01_FULL_40_39]|uniref:Large ribosomal subunit protein uL15 n=1 Tax=Candidatus Staskawiczbacteria bacterium RIFCSPHIGHO2_01_FULL_39_25 TaxID=1802202 RepID=A0A1G2HRZ6_9BACT|nr:MAG: 50S ribosomal protein L15 [Candidatus Staskawiczbacteria bacterium RIFCSPHIGHO2_01_FULL_39_25]OGZ72666.1 MAG: 50S ribosomal protein L15 [Candidatus Staskawiczbacteria bacterium RIFCSPLOWO2_01_FULL_40_39]OGZ75841.1 MAG: 50S ribosomal protein L15 [Candidatus Staskawiczbacteria bacterium RIFCSPLOWO2_02_FULL_39_8]
MQIHQLQPIHSSKNRKRVGRGGKKGTYSGKGGKGQTARAGRKLAPIIRELIKRYPKLKGYRRFVLENNSTVVNLDMLNKHFKDGEVVNPANLITKGIVHMIKGKVGEVKILGKGVLDKKLTIENCKVSETAKKAIEKAGGTVK